MQTTKRDSSKANREIKLGTTLQPKRQNKQSAPVELDARSLRHVQTLDPEAERELARLYCSGNQDAGRRLIEASLPFVIRIAREYRRWGVPIEDLVQQGNLGLLKAAR